MHAPPRRSVAGALRWWMPLLALVAGTAALVFAAWIGGVDVGAAMQHVGERLAESMHHESKGWGNEAGFLRLEFDIHGKVKAATHDDKPLPLSDLLIEDGYVTVTSLAWPDGELQYWHLPLDWENELRENVRSPRTRLEARVHPRPEGEPVGLRVARVGKDGPGEKGGLRVGDVIVGVGGAHAGTSAGLQEALEHAIAELAPGGKLALTVQRQDGEEELSFSLPSLVNEEDWADTPGDDPVQRYFDLVTTGPRRHRRAEVRVQEIPHVPAPPPPDDH